MKRLLAAATAAAAALALTACSPDPVPEGFQGYESVSLDSLKNDDSDPSTLVGWLDHYGVPVGGLTERQAVRTAMAICDARDAGLTDSMIKKMMQDGLPVWNEGDREIALQLFYIDQCSEYL